MSDDHIKRCDVRVPINLYNEIEKIAVEEYNAPLYHKTGKPQVSSTIIELLKLGIENLRGEVSDNLPDTLSGKLSELESQIKQIQSASLSDNQSDTIPDINIDEKIDRAVTSLKSDREFLKAIALEVQKISTAAKDDDKYCAENAIEQAEAKEDEEETITQIDKASLAPIFEDEDEDEDEVDFQGCTVSHLRKIVTIKGLGKKFREKLGKYPGNAKKAEIVKFLNETSIFDLD
jgi:hypothetical protein